MAAALPEGGRVITCELNAGRAAFARGHLQRSPVADRVEIAEGPALDTIAAIDEPLDLVFVDAEKEGYVDYYEAVVPKLSERGLIVADNTWRGGRATDPADAIARFNAHVDADPRTVQVLLTVRDGVTLIRLAP
jgi:caffeoyl-CoA O-methyltransferase